MLLGVAQKGSESYPDPAEGPGLTEARKRRRGGDNKDSDQINFSHYLFSKGGIYRTQRRYSLHDWQRQVAVLMRERPVVAPTSQDEAEVVDDPPVDNFDWQRGTYGWGCAYCGALVCRCSKLYKKEV